jgi:putative heme-binding domain-containing protein
VRFQLAFSLGEWKDDRAARALGRLLRRDAAEPYLQAAAMTSLTKANLGVVLGAVLEGGAPPAGVIEALMRQASAMGDDRAVVGLLKRIARVPAGEAPGWRLDVLAAFLDGLAARRSSLARLAREGPKEIRAAASGLGGLFRSARVGAVDDKLPEAERLRCVRLLGREGDHIAEDRDLLSRLLAPTVAPTVQSAAVQALARLDDPKVPALLLAGWKGQAPALRSQVLQALLERPARVPALLDAIEKKQVLALELDASRRQALLEHRDAKVRKRAQKVLAGAVDPDRQKVIDAYRGALSRAGEAAKGKAVYEKSCAACHKLGGLGNEVGPDLAALRDKSAEYLLIAVLDPNRAVEARYVSYQAELADGRVRAGLVAGETGTSITLVGVDGKPEVVLRKDLERLTSTGKSLMPEGIEKDVSPEAMADLLAFLRSQAPLPRPKSFPGNKPEVVRAGKDGELRLTAQNAEIHGPSLVLEKQYGNLGLWQSPDDRAVWTVEVPRAGRYAVWLDHACDPSSAGNRFVLEADEVLLKAKAESTGSWDVYKQTRFGEVKLPAGRVRLTMRAEGRIRGALPDLRAVRLAPVK